MKRILIGLSVLAAACSGPLPTSPSGSSTVQSLPSASAPTAADPVVVNPVDPTPPASGANAPTPQYTLTGPRDPQNCLTAGTGPLQWVLNVTDAGPRALRFIAVSHQDDQPGCGQTIKNPRSRIELSGVSNYTPHSSGQTTLTFNTEMYNCGRVQVDVSIFDAAGNEILIIGLVINYGTVCTPPPPPPPGSFVCAPATQSALVGQSVTFTASGGSGTYTWSAPSGSPATGSGASFSTAYNAAGSYVATVTSGGATATCQVTITNPVVSQLVCAPSTQTVAIGAVATMVASGGTGTYSWSAPGGSTATGSGSTFGTSYAAAGTNTVTVTSGTQTATCQVITTTTPPPPPPTLVCAPPTQSVGVGVLATMTATGGTGAYTWSAPGGSPATGTGGTFSTAYPGAGTNTVTVTSGTQTATCVVTVTPTPPPTLVCAPPTQTVAAGVLATMSATGGTGAFSWSAPGGSPATGTGATFSTSYPGAGTNTVTVTSGAQTATCSITVTPPPPPPAPICAPAATNPPPAGGVPLTFNISNAVAGVAYTWATAPAGGTPATGTGTTFTASFVAPPAGGVALIYTVTPSAPGAAGTPCTVTIPAPPAAACPAPTFSTVYPFNNDGAVPLTGSATISGGGTWTFTLWAGHGRPDDSDFNPPGYHGQDIKEQVTVQCVVVPGATPPFMYTVLPITDAPPEASHGETWHGTVPPNQSGATIIPPGLGTPGSVTMSFMHFWGSHPNNFWWIELYHKPAIGPGVFVVGPPSGPGNWLDCKDTALIGGVCRPPKP